MGKESKTPAAPQTLEEALAQIAGLSEKLATAEEKNLAQAETIKEQAALIDELSDSLAIVQAKVNSGDLTPTITIGKKTYKITCGVKHMGQNLSAAQLAENASVCEELLTIKGQNILVLETKEKED